MRCLRPVLSVVLLASGLVGLAGCTMNPATGKQSFTAFMSREDELRVGAEEHPKFIKRFGGEYGNAHLRAYVRGVGATLARVSEVPGLNYTFTLLNHKRVNAFALPGGYVYITRGMLALAVNEAEMAGVLAHEIGHITARHAAQRYSQAMAANLGLGIFGILGGAAGLPSDTGNVVSLGANAVLRGFSREQELEADMLGVRYMSRAGYHPDAMRSFLGKLEAHNKLEALQDGRPEAAGVYDFMSTHPRTTDRIAQAVRLANATLVPDARFGQGDYLARMDGLLYGDDPEQGVIRGREFVHPEMRFRFEVPPGFILFNSAAEVRAQGPGGALITFDMAPAKRARQFQSVVDYLVREWGGKISLRDVERIRVNAMEGATGSARLSGKGGARDLRLVVIRERRDRIYRLAFVSPPKLTGRLSEEFRRTTYSFRLLSREEAGSIRPLRIQVVTVGSGDTVEALTGRMAFETYAREWFEVLNGLDRGQPLVHGNPLKIVVE